ncbi:MAG: MFS transporter [Alphaproteobacteria bacterium]|nr:MFS transporter [Alphaproteobacteria bacterium]
MNETVDNHAKSWVLALTALASFMVALDAVAVSTALSTIRFDLGASIEALEWAVNAYNLTFAVLLLTGAALGDRFGRRRMFAAGLLLFVIASVACALSRDATALIASRAVQGAGAALVMPLAMALLSASFPREERARALGIFGSVTGIALIAGPILGGAIAQALDWRFIFWLNLPVGLAMLPLVRARIAESRGSDADLDFGGIVLVTGAALGVVWGLMRANAAGWGSLEVLASFAIGLALAVIFVTYEQRIAAPMVPMRLFGARGFSAGNAAGFCLYASMYGVLFFLPQFLQVAQGNGPLATGLRLLPWEATLFVFAPIGGTLVNRIGERALIVAGLLMQAVGFALIALIAAPALPYASLVAPLLMAGAGVSMAMPAAQHAVLGAVAPAEIGKASGTFNMLRFLGGVFGVTVLATLFTAHGGYGSAAAVSNGFTVAMGLAALLSFAGAIAGLWLPGRAVAVTAGARA